MQKLRNLIQDLAFRILPRIGRFSRTNTPGLVVLVHLENLGDFILFSAVIKEVRRNFPNSKLVVVGQKENREVVKFCPLVDQWVWIRGHRKPKLGESTGRETSYYFKIAITYLKLLVKFKMKIDLLIGPDWLLTKHAEQFQNNILYRKANVSSGFAEKHLKVDFGKYIAHTHQVPRNLSVLEMLGLNVTTTKTESWLLPDTSSLAKQDKEIFLKGRPKIVISLGAGHARRNYPPEELIKAIGRISIERPDVIFIIIGPKSLDVQKLNKLFENLSNTQNLIGKTDIGIAGEIISSAALVIANDSGFAHLAASLEIATLVISAHPIDADPWHLHSPNRYHPWMTEYVELQPPHLQHPCVGSCLAEEPHCIKSVLPEDIAISALSLLDKTKSNSG